MSTKKNVSSGTIISGSSKFEKAFSDFYDDAVKFQEVKDRWILMMRNHPVVIAGNDTDFLISLSPKELLLVLEPASEEACIDSLRRIRVRQNEVAIKMEKDISNGKVFELQYENELLNNSN